MPQQVGRIIVHPVRTRPLELVSPVPPRKQANSQRQGPSRGEHIPDAVADYDAVGDWDVELLGGSQKHIGVRFGVAHLISSHDWGAGVELE